MRIAPRPTTPPSWTRRCRHIGEGWRRGYRGSWHRRCVAICWFKPGAQEHVARCWQIARLLQRYGIAVELVRTRKPGYVTYEDAWQIVAMPFGDE
jgi:hypothetical protein